MSSKQTVFLVDYYFAHCCFLVLQSNRIRIRRKNPLTDFDLFVIRNDRSHLKHLKLKSHLKTTNITLSFLPATLARINSEAGDERNKSYSNGFERAVLDCLIMPYLSYCYRLSALPYGNEAGGIRLSFFGNSRQTS